MTNAKRLREGAAQSKSIKRAGAVVLEKMPWMI
jgi:hypothetical protein